MITRYVCTALMGLLGAVSISAQPPVGLPPIKTVDYDQRGVFRVNGKPFFPIALYDATLDDRTLRELHEFGFNVLACDTKSSTTLPAKGFYGAVHADKKLDNLEGAFMVVGADSPALSFKKDLLKQTADSNA